MPGWLGWSTSLAIAIVCVLLAIVGLGTTPVGKRLLVTGRFMLGWHQIAEQQQYVVQAIETTLYEVELSPTAYQRGASIPQQRGREQWGRQTHTITVPATTDLRTVETQLRAAVHRVAYQVLERRERHRSTQVVVELVLGVVGVPTDIVVLNQQPIMVELSLPHAQEVIPPPLPLPPAVVSPPLQVARVPLIQPPKAGMPSARPPHAVTPPPHQETRSSVPSSPRTTPTPPPPPVADGPSTLPKVVAWTPQPSTTAPPSPRPQDIPVVPQHPVRPPSTRPSQVAIVIDDLGWDLAAAQTLLDIDTPLSFAILPEAPYRIQIAQEARRRGRDVLLHLPMESYGASHISLGPYGLHSTMTSKELTARVEAALQALPLASGVNNHMGSRLTENRATMQTVLRSMKRHQLFFLDSRTSKDSLAYQVAQELGVPAARRQVFLDNEAEPGKITQQLQRLITLAQQQGSAIAIGHPYPATVQVLQHHLPALRRTGIEIVPISRLVR